MNSRSSKNKAVEFANLHTLMTKRPKMPKSKYINIYICI